jgi:glutamate--cysteine ligase
MAHASRLRTPDDTPSARVLEHLLSRKVSFADFALTLSRQHARHWQEDPLSASMQATFEEEAAQSLSQQSLLESTDQMDFDAFLKAYRSQS